MHAYLTAQLAIDNKLPARILTDKTDMFILGSTGQIVGLDS